MSKTVLQNGFSAISWSNYVPRDSTKKKGQALQAANHLFNVEEVREPGKETEILAKCVKQTNVTEAPWNLNIKLDSNRNVLRARCSCTAGGDGQCKHMYSLVDYINSERTEASTDEICKFKAPSQKGKSLYPKGKPADEIFKNTPISKLSFKISEERKDQIHADLQAVGETDSMMAILLQKRAQGFPKIAASASQEITVPDWLLQALFPSEQVPIFGDNLQAEKIAFLKEKVIVSKENAIKLCQDTVSQSASSLWREERKIRITASRAHKIASAQTDATRIKYFQEQKSLDGIEAVKYGIANEETARKEFEQFIEAKVFQCGLVVSLQYPFIAVSPDGLFVDSDGNLCLLEIKCPFSMRDSDVIDVPYVKDDQLKQKHCYYSQVQLTMFVCGVKVTHFYMFAPKISRHIIVYLDEDFC